ncbi:hypothetical protein C8F04DRAFT_1178449 [Mycena alexandri]|uniref:Uncharacterized protein n=1 Tax=Mycena alexandri TaxID=1745969 RepID=A0AAD6X8W6_9AGAR|nr:hypothetical protein C8F04DRAFT_1178449 [Mycena alexandri]
MSEFTPAAELKDSEEGRANKNLSHDKKVAQKGRRWSRRRASRWIKKNGKGKIWMMVDSRRAPNKRKEEGDGSLAEPQPTHQRTGERPDEVGFLRRGLCNQFCVKLPSLATNVKQMLQHWKLLAGYEGEPALRLSDHYLIGTTRPMAMLQVDDTQSSQGVVPLLMQRAVIPAPSPVQLRQMYGKAASNTAGWRIGP